MLISVKEIRWCGWTGRVGDALGGWRKRFWWGIWGCWRIWWRGLRLSNVE